MAKPLRLGVNIDHVATIRNARGGWHPDPVRAARLAVRAGADGITAHLREDRRHISEADITALRQSLSVPLNLEMAATDEMLAIALRHKPKAVCIVPERREERTTEGGLDTVREHDHLRPYVQRLGESGIQVALFVEPSLPHIDAGRKLGAAAVELHTGLYSTSEGDTRRRELARLIEAAVHAERLSLECHAGHGLSFENVGPIAAIPSVVELNIGHFLIGEAIFCGLEASVQRMRALMQSARSGVADHE